MEITDLEMIPLAMEFEGTIKKGSFDAVGLREDNAVLKTYTDEGITGPGEDRTLSLFYPRERNCKPGKIVRCSENRGQ